MVLQVTQFGGFGATSPVRPGFYNTVGSNSALTTYTFSSQNLGPPAPNRYILLAVFSADTGSGTWTLNTATVNGVSAVKATDNGGSNPSWFFSTTIFAAAVPTGTSGDIVVTASEALVGLEVTYLVVYGLTSTTAVAANSANNGTPGAFTVNTDARGITFGMICHTSNGVAVTSKDKFSALIRDSDDVGGTNRVAVLYGNDLPTVTSNNITVTLASGPVAISRSIATFV